MVIYLGIEGVFYFSSNSLGVLSNKSAMVS